MAAQENKLTERERAIIKALAANDMNLARAAKAAYMSTNSLSYNIDKIKSKTGLDCKRFYDLIELVQMADADE